MVTATKNLVNNKSKKADSLEECLEKIDADFALFVSYEEIVEDEVNDSLRYANVVENKLDDIDLAGYRQKARSGES